MMDWSNLLHLCVDHVARDLARTEAGHNELPFEERMARWVEAQKAARPEATKKIAAMNGLELLGLISEVAGLE